MEKKDVFSELFSGFLYESVINKVSDEALKLTREKYPYLKINFRNYGNIIVDHKKIAIIINDKEKTEAEEIQKIYSNFLDTLVYEEIEKIVKKIVG